MITTKKLISDIDRLLKPAGFVRHNFIWNRSGKQIVEVVDIQTSKTGDQITINTGILDRDAYRDFWGRDVSDFVDEPSCTVHVRVGQLIDNRDKWWQVKDETAVEEVSGDIANYVLPFLEKT